MKVFWWFQRSLLIRLIIKPKFGDEVFNILFGSGERIVVSKLASRKKLNIYKEIYLLQESKRKSKIRNELVWL